MGPPKPGDPIVVQARSPYGTLVILPSIVGVMVP